MKNWTRFTQGLYGLAILAVCAATSVADVPRKTHYQGKLLTTDGTFVAGSVTLRVRLYDALENGNQLFDETHTGVTLNKGLFSILIGSKTTDGVPDSALDEPAVYLGVSVDSGSESRATRISSCGVVRSKRSRGVYRSSYRGRFCSQRPTLRRTLSWPSRTARFDIATGGPDRSSTWSFLRRG